MRPLRDYQAKAIEDLRASLKAGRRRPVLQLPVGAGKTRVAAEIIGLALSKGKAGHLHGSSHRPDRPDRRRLPARGHLRGWRHAGHPRDD
jgi:hypothetical protein